ncbi:hypothetical protein EV385_0350 [Krasilnikovia cinnamomea]|uniref:Uncharacterized protein n=1 Tax=Krasilnikovia cinnamomea TaxID=349313 RepID=A0A4Q7ZET3_9ACTN|nr:hypothetical protein [Krasilnikovia cinnamomea]RZU48633.1 hypothetical protein EV385_0350 [Krasilnikovia cinnamomea]
MRHRAALLLAVPVVAAAAAFLVLPSAASAAPGPGGAEVRITEAPRTLDAGEDADTVTAVVTTDRGGRCRKVRWSAVLRAEGPSLDQVRVQRIEDDGDFAVQVQAAGDAARLTDVQFDPGELCRGKTVTARYRIAVDEDAPQGRITLEVQAFEGGVRALGAAVTTATVQGEGAQPEPSESEEAEPSPSPDESDDTGGAAVGDTTEPSGRNPGAAAPAADNAASSSDGSSGLLGPGLIVGALLVFAGVGLLLRLRTRNRAARHPMPTSFYPAP